MKKENSTKIKEGMRIMTFWEEKHSVNCYFCGILIDERDCENADNYNNNDGGSICQKCLSTKL